jgi:hypothetical protein
MSEKVATEGRAPFLFWFRFVGSSIMKKTNFATDGMVCERRAQTRCNPPTLSTLRKKNQERKRERKRGTDKEM